MRFRFLILVAVATAGAANADILVPAHTIRARQVITAADLLPKAAEFPGALDDPALVIGMEARTALFADRPIRASDIAPPALVERNQVVKLVFRHGGLEITAEGRSLGRGAAGDTVRVLNTASRSSLSGRIRSDGMIEVGPND